MITNQKRWKWLVLLMSLAVTSAVFSRPWDRNDSVILSRPLSPRIANYDIEVRLDPDNRMLYGKETLNWINETNDQITELQFHLYLNAFRNNKSTFMKESGGISRGNKIDEDGWGFIEVNSITLPDGEELVDRMKFIHPDDDNEHDKTVFSIDLDQPILPGDSIKLNMDFHAKLPTPPFARTGAKEEYFFVGQWFPKIGVHQNGSWNCHQFHANSEFFADFGVYDVWITTPKDFIVGATGLEMEQHTNDDTTITHYYRAEDVHDFAWTASPEFVEIEERAMDVNVRILLQPDHTNQSQRHVEAAKTAIRYFQSWYGDYPFPNLTIVDPRRGAMGSAGMEYPTLITAGTFYGLPSGLRMAEIVIIHEFGHNYWYHLVASNEFEEPWLDEGINTFSEIQIIDDHYGPHGSVVDFLGIQINDSQLQRAQYIFQPDLDPIVKNAWEFYSGTSYSVNSYARSALVLLTLRNYLGEETMREIMRTYFFRWTFRHPTTQDFIDVANEVSGQNLDWYFDQALFTNNVLDYSVDRVFTRKLKKSRGYDFNLALPDQDTTLAVNETDSTVNTTSDSLSTSQITVDSAYMVSDTTDTSETEGQQLYRSGVNIRRLGDFVFPVEVEMVFSNGDTTREHWDGKDLWKKYRYIKPAKLVSAKLDPDEKIPIDINFTNNSGAVEEKKIGVNKLSVRFLFWMQFLLDMPEFLNLFTGMSFDFN